jgi:hypothetical protein
MVDISMKKKKPSLLHSLKKLILPLVLAAMVVGQIYTLRRLSADEGAAENIMSQVIGEIIKIEQYLSHAPRDGKPASYEAPVFSN